MIPSRYICLALFLLCGCRPEQKPHPIIRHMVLYEDADIYAAWPAIVRMKSGDLFVAFTATEKHISPDGRIVAIRSSDNGQTWSAPIEVYDSPIDDRESGLTRLQDGRLLVHIWSTHWTRELYENAFGERSSSEEAQRWIEHVESPEYLAAEDLHGGWLGISSDEGQTWSPVKEGPDTIHGGVELQDGSLLVASYRHQKNHVGVFAADDADSSWHLVAEVHSPIADRVRFGEPHILQLDSGRILMMIRPTAIPYDDQNRELYLWQTWSDDKGRTWVDPVQTPLWGFPPHLLQLQDGRVVVSYGYRRPPYGQRVAVSEDGITWSDERIIALRDDAPNHDLGYPVSIELAPDTVLTVYYQRQETGKVDILGTVWAVPASDE